LDGKRYDPGVPGMAIDDPFKYLVETVRSLENSESITSPMRYAA
jgi:hypothetical protein